MLSAADITQRECSTGIRIAAKLLKAETFAMTEADIETLLAS